MSRPNEHSKGQFFSQDALFAMVLVIFLFSLYMETNARVARSMDDHYLRMKLREAADQAASQLVESPGAPFTWQQAQINSSMESMGLASAYAVLDTEKTLKFFSLTQGSAEYNATKDLLGLTMADSGFNATLVSSDGSAAYELSAQPASYTGYFGSSNVTAATARMVVFNGTAARFTMVVWLE